MSSDNQNLNKAKKDMQDEFYTRYNDIQQEINAYIDFNKDVFRDKTVLLPCDDPEWSNFTKFFAQNFELFGIKKLISTSFAVESKKYKEDYIPTLFETRSPIYDIDKTRLRGKIFTLSRENKNNDRIDYNKLEWKYLEGDGDFRSDEVKKLRDEADIIVTNPPFSLLKDFLLWLRESNKKFLIIGNINNISLKDVFPMIKEGFFWMGVTMDGNGQHWFRVPKEYDNGTIKEVDGERYATIGNACWYTNLEHGLRHQPLTLMTMEENLLYSDEKNIQDNGYEEFDNYKAIYVPKIDVIPDDYEGVMGVPLSFLSRFCPEQFEIVGITENDRKDGSNKEVVELYKEGNHKYDRPYLKGKRMFPKLLIRKVK